MNPFSKIPKQTLINIFGPFLGLLLVVGLFSLDGEVREVFLTGANFKIIFSQTVIVAICALGMTLIIVSGGIDLSVGSVLALSSVTGALLVRNEFPILAMVPLTLMAGMAAGMINGGLIAGLGIAPFIVTLGMMGIARGMAKWLAGNQTVNFPAASIAGWMRDPDPLGWMPPAGVWVAVILAVLVSLLLNRTVFGRSVFSIGSNEATARLCGLPTRRIKLGIYALSGALFALAGLLQLSRLRQGDPTTGIGTELDVIAAVVIGGASLNGGTGSILGSMIGALIMAVLRNGSQQMGWSNSSQDIIIGMVIILAVALDRFRQSRNT